MTTIRQRPALTRRRLLAGASALVLLGGVRSFARQEPGGGEGKDSEQDRLDLIRRTAAEAGFPELRLDEGERYVGLGSAPDDFLQGALKLCEGLADDYLSHFKAKGFGVEAPDARMTLVALANHEEFTRFIGEDLHPDVTGIYEIEPNYLVLYDGRGGRAGAQAERANTITLFHEATHQLTFNTGLLDRYREAPLTVLEGLAMYGEVRRPDGRTRIGTINEGRWAVLLGELRRGGSLIPLADLFEDDDLLAQDSTVQLAYAQSWLLVYALMKDSRAISRFRSYLDALREAEPDRDRVELAEEHLGTLDQLETFLKGVLVRLNRGRG